MCFLFFREGKGGRKRGRETSVCCCLSWTPHQEAGPHNPGMCPDWEPNQWSFGLQSSAQSTEPHQPGKPCVLTYSLWHRSWRGRWREGLLHYSEKSRNLDSLLSHLLCVCVKQKCFTVIFKRTQKQRKQYNVCTCKCTYHTTSALSTAGHFSFIYSLPLSVFIFKLGYFKANPKFG